VGREENTSEEGRDIGGLLQKSRAGGAEKKKGKRGVPVSGRGEAKASRAVENFPPSGGGDDLFVSSRKRGISYSTGVISCTSERHEKGRVIMRGRSY